MELINRFPNSTRVVKKLTKPGVPFQLPSLKMRYPNLAKSRALQ